MISPSREARLAHAFTLVEIMVTVVIIGLLAAMVVPAMIRYDRRAQASRFVSDLRTFTEAYETYAMKNGRWPPDSGRGDVPAGMSGELRDQDWMSRNSLGGLWDWDYKVFGHTAGISTVEVTVGDDEMKLIDGMIDDGNLATGNFVMISSDRYMYILQK